MIAPHPFAGLQGIRDEVYSTWIDAVEIHNYRHRKIQETRLAKQAWRQLGLAGIAASDAHNLGEIGRFCTEFDDPVTNEQDLIAAVRAGRCRPRPKPPPSGVRSWLKRIGRRA